MNLYCVVIMVLCGHYGVLCFHYCIVLFQKPGDVNSTKNSPGINNYSCVLIILIHFYFSSFCQSRISSIKSMLSNNRWWSSLYCTMYNIIWHLYYLAVFPQAPSFQLI